MNRNLPQLYDGSADAVQDKITRQKTVSIKWGNEKSQKSSRVTFARAAPSFSPYETPLTESFKFNQYISLYSKFKSFWDLMDTVNSNGYMRAALGVIGRTVAGTDWDIVSNPRYLNKTKNQKFSKKKNALLDFYYSSYKDQKKNWKGISEFQTFASKVLFASEYYKLFGQCAFEVRRNKAGKAIGLDNIIGFVAPNVDEAGMFKNPSFIQYPSRDPRNFVEFKNPTDIVFIANPDLEGSVSGSSEIMSLSEYALPLDIYLSLTAREYMKNRDKPESLFVLPADIDDDTFDSFVAMIEERWRGPYGAGRSPIVAQGDLHVEELSKMPKDLPYLDARNDTRREILAGIGVPQVKLGIYDDANQALFKEARRDFHETSIAPFLKILEQSLFEQVHVREFSTPEWVITFKSPDFLTAVERATVHMRYHDMGVLSPNEIRNDLGYSDREDEAGDEYVDGKTDNEQGSPPEGREERPDAPNETGEPTLDDQDPERGDGHDEA